jgi:1,4-dihydroxy-2-naphthoyl-CoA synthase
LLKQVSVIVGARDLVDKSISDMVVASPTAIFGLPEATVGLYAAAGGLPRIVRNVGLQIASEVAMTGRRLSAQEVTFSEGTNSSPFMLTF